ncbi:MULTISPECIES: thiol:disulfide interchange protein DsbA/DsbL [Limnobacter]|uniref:Thiol:disulfide interchange protein n=1 Tax=Limnobacter litoralis TaxID=481366 RepID=A0ABQ5YSX8_9BURK|nr:MULTISPECIES: thiol:disulfide interchange protein DsbA/DsbL [Limnobacter]GLR25532.1 thiol:disulfide interchange protein DsbA [Limnobacter litoralis]HEX5486056.1 thiol:disulfide interchange protein DsbA/DsbL [Limnobacter sp.]
MDRRNWIKNGILLGAMAKMGLPMAWSQDAGAYRKVERPIPRSKPNKIEVIEFFWYGCPHCFHFEPALNAWVKKLPADVYFHRIPVAWPSKRVNFAGHQKLYFTLEAMGLVDQYHDKVFDAMHVQKKRLDSDAEIFDLAQSFGLNREQFANTFKSFSVNAKCKQAVDLATAYGVDGVPTLGIDGKFTTSASVAGSEENALRVASALIERERQASKT